MTTSETKTQEVTEPRRVEEVVARPAVDIFERAGEYVIVADVPGVDQQHLSLSLEDRVLTLDGRVVEAEADAGTLLYRELGPVRYCRTFELSEDIDEAKISATVKDGVLRLTLPKLEQRAPRKIAVQAG